jgi:hypothetical protein
MSRIRVMAAAPVSATRPAPQKESLVGGMFMTIVFFGLLGLTIALALWGGNGGHGFVTTI